MSTHAWTEDRLVEQPAIELFGTLGWQTVSALEETFGSPSPPPPLPPGEGRVCLGRETRGEGELDVLFSGSADLDAYLWMGGDRLLNQHLFNVVLFAGCSRADVEALPS